MDTDDNIYHIAWLVRFGSDDALDEYFKANPSLYTDEITQAVIEALIKTDNQYVKDNGYTRSGAINRKAWENAYAKSMMKIHRNDALGFITCVGIGSAVVVPIFIWVVFKILA
jgi:hypothetical protein